MLGFPYLKIKKCYCWFLVSGFLVSKIFTFPEHIWYRLPNSHFMFCWQMRNSYPSFYRFYLTNRYHSSILIFTTYNKNEVLKLSTQTNNEQQQQQHKIQYETAVPMGFKSLRTFSNFQILRYENTIFSKIAPYFLDSFEVVW